ncbi:MAG TPA: hypothetical protein VIB02_03025 [Candidatus Limnocylindrales bacterium]
MAGGLGYCGLDPRRQPLRGDEIRGCWEAWPEGHHHAVVPLTIAPARPLDEARRPLAFVEVASDGLSDGEGEDPAVPSITPGGPPAAEPGWSLWGDAEA